MPVARAFEPPDVSDPPFLAPLECVVDLPFPPSTNRIWRHDGNHRNRMIHLSPEYRKWKDKADVAVVANGCWRKRVVMPGRFSVLILLSRARQRGDLDNRIKALLDWAQRVELILDDKFCEEITARWAPTAECPHGCRMIFRSVA